MYYLIKECFENRGIHPRFLIEDIELCDNFNLAWKEVMQYKHEWQKMGLEFITRQGIHIRDNKPIQSIYVYNMKFRCWDYRFRIVKRLSGDALLYYNHDISNQDTGYSETWNIRSKFWKE